MIVWVDGALRAPDQRHVSVLDHGFTVGDGVFETLKVVDGVPFALRRHLERLRTSAHGLGIEAPDADYVRAACGQVIAAGAEHGRYRLRITWTAGPGPLGSDRSGHDHGTLAVVAAPISQPPDSVRLAIAPWVRNERSAVAGLKTTSYAENVVALAYARERGADEAVLGNTRGALCEGTGSNVFVVLDGMLVTPPLSSGCLAGITRALVLEWCDAQEQPVELGALWDAEEVFITSSTRDVMPVSGVDHVDLAAPGPVTKGVMDTFGWRSQQQPDP